MVFNISHLHKAICCFDPFFHFLLISAFPTLFIFIRFATSYFHNAFLKMKIWVFFMKILVVHTWTTHIFLLATLFKKVLPAHMQRKHDLLVYIKSQLNYFTPTVSSSFFHQKWQTCCQGAQMAFASMALIYWLWVSVRWGLNTQYRQGVELLYLTRGHRP